MKLYTMAGACSLASHIALRWAGASFERVQLTHEEAGGDAFRAINPKRAVPTLVFDDGTVITESLAILVYIADRFPDARLGSDGNDPVERARLNERLSELVSDVHKAWAPVFVPERFVTEAAFQDDARLAAFAQLDGQYERLDALMRDREWLVLDRRTVADAYLYVMCRWKEKTPTPLERYPALSRFKSRLDEDVDVRSALTQEASS